MTRARLTGMSHSAITQEGKCGPEWTDSRRALVCLRYGIGDLVMQLPMLESLRRALPEARITALGAFPAIQLLEREAPVDEVVDIRRWGFRHRWDEGTGQSRDDLTAWIGESGFDLVFDPGHAAPGVAQSIWRHTLPMYDADPAAEAEALQSGASGQQAMRAAVLAGWGLRVPDHPSPRLRLSRAERHFAEDFLVRLGVSGQAPIAASAVASHPLKRWPARSLERAIVQLVEVHERDAVVFRGPGSALEQLERRHRVHSVPALHLRRTAALLARCGVLICNDTGLMHLAAAVGTPSVATFGPTASRLFRPTVAHAIAVQSTVGCPHRRTTSLGPAGCWSGDRCLIAERSCTDQIDVDVVTRAASRLLRADAAVSSTVGLSCSGI